MPTELLFRDIIYEVSMKIMLEGKYGEFDIIIKKDGLLINATKLCNQGNKIF